MRSIHAARVQHGVTLHADEQITSGTRVDAKLAQRFLVRVPQLSLKGLVHVLRRHAGAKAETRA
jgi:hypothetical protein